VIFDKHPLSNFAKVQKVFIDGQLYFDRSRELSGRGEREARKRALMERARQREAEFKKTSARRPQ